MRDGSNKSEPKKIFGLVALIVTLVICTTGATYAYFAISATNNNVISGTSARVGNTLTVTKILPTSANAGTGVMVPQYSSNTTKRTNALKTAIDGNCVDANGNVACQVYKIEYQNTSSSAIRINSTLTLTSTITNLKWYTLKEVNDSTTSGSSPTYVYPGSFTSAYGNAKSITALGSANVLNTNNYRYWYVVIWIEETGSDQYSADGDKTFTGTVNVQATDAAGNTINGITSTFTG